MGLGLKFRSRGSRDIRIDRVDVKRASIRKGH